MRIFIPLTDEMLEKGVFPEELLAYQAGLPLLSQYQSSSTVKMSPGSTPSSDATPALSSSTYMAGLLLG